jgi:hypothetical protein
LPLLRPATPAHRPAEKLQNRGSGVGIVYAAESTGLLLSDTVNDIFSKKGKSYPNFNEEFEWTGVLKNLRRSLAEARERQMPIFFAPMSYTGEDYTTWTHLSPASIRRCTAIACSRPVVGAPTSAFTDATAAIGGKDAYDAMMLRYPLISHATFSVDEFVAANGNGVRAS